ncbi:MAG: 4-hydroxy-3-methylbut-2-enyl diphosphate reductase, partial [Candidatus Omnitrophica bacterium]|nr:4-hydroxy-3-methylbut-2-enyl diphosphate reductase [Candidatus Omnitrophota bacterium]
VMVVVGGKNSANTKRLHQICKESKVTSYHIERESELKGRFFSGKKCAGVVSGASTPDSTVKKVVKRIKNLAGQV